MAFVSAELARAGAAVITAPSTPKAALRDALRATVLQSAGPGGNFFNVHISTPLEYCEENDRTGIYAKARRGELKGVAGIDEAFETSARADLTIDLTKQSVSEAVTSERSFTSSGWYVKANYGFVGIILLLETNALL